MTLDRRVLAGISTYLLFLEGEAAGGEVGYNTDIAAAIFVGGVDLPTRKQGGRHAMQKSLSVVAAEGLCESFFCTAVRQELGH